MNYTYSIDIINRETLEIEKHMEAIGLNKAEKAKRGVEVNLNHVDYFVRITKQD